MRRRGAFLIAAAGVGAAASPPLHARFVAAFPLQHAAVSSFAESFPGSSSPALLVTTFAAFGNEPVYVVPDLAEVMQSRGGSAAPQRLESDTVWTNYVAMAPKEAVGDRNVVVTAGGFLVPGRSLGTIDLWEVSDPTAPLRTKVSTDNSGWFYHKVVWHDMNGDGLLDIVTARATAGGNKGGELVWLEQPKSDALSNTTDHPWAEHPLIAGPDVDFAMEDLDGDGRFEVIAAQFFTAPMLAIYSCPSASWSQCDGSTIKATVLDQTVGPFFTVQRKDMNGDGKPDLLVTNNEDDGTGAVFVYEQPANIFTDPWTRHKIAGNFRPVPSILPQPPHAKGAPGSAQAFWPQIGSGASGEKPWVLLSGDDAGFVAVLRPRSEDVLDWAYDQDFILNSSGTIGSPTLGDADGDGILEIMVPCYGDGKIEVYTFSSSPTPPPPSLQQCSACLAEEDPVHLSPTHAWCYKDGACHAVGSPVDPCGPAQCASAAEATHCGCTNCNDPACWAAPSVGGPRVSLLV